MDLTKKVAYITGGSKGIGYGVAEKLLAQGMKVAISGRTKATVEAAAASLGTSDQVLALVSDVTILADEQTAVKAIIEKWGSLDVVLANAGVGHFASVDELTETQWNQMLNTNLTGAFFTLKASVGSWLYTGGHVRS